MLYLTMYMYILTTIYLDFGGLYNLEALSRRSGCTCPGTALLLAKAEERGFPGMLGSIDCMHWQWRNCPVAHAGQFTRGDIKYPTIILEVVASYDRWIWHAFLGWSGPTMTLTY
jgi:hypothetical protein